MKNVLMQASCAVVCAAGLLVSGCAMFRSSVSESDVNNPVRMGASYDYEDLRTLGKTVGDAVADSAFLKDMATPPTFVVMGIQNRTSEHIDTKALTDTMRQTIMESTKTKFVNEAQRDNLLQEQGYQLAHCTAETRVAIGKQLGANYMLTGSLVEIKKKSARQARVSRQEEVYFQLTMEVTDLETGLIAWTTQKERARTISKPIVAW